MTSPSNSTSVFERFNINTLDISAATVEAMHKAYHDILAAIDKAKEDGNGDLSTRRNKVMAEWLANHDLPTELHEAIDETEEVIFDTVYSDPATTVMMLAPAYTRILALASELKRFLNNEINKIANPGGKRNIIGTKAECKTIRTVAQSLAIVYDTHRLMNPSLPQLPTLEWANIPPGRDVEMADLPYTGHRVMYSLGTHHHLTKTEFLDLLNEMIPNRLTRVAFDNYLEDSGLSLHGEWTHTYEGVEFSQHVIATT